MSESEIAELVDGAIDECLDTYRIYPDLLLEIEPDELVFEICRKIYGRIPTA